MEEPERIAIDAHLALCEECREDLERASRFDEIEVGRLVASRQPSSQDRLRFRRRAWIPGLLALMAALWLVIWFVATEEPPSCHRIEVEGPSRGRIRGQGTATEGLERFFIGPFRLHLAFERRATFHLLVLSIPDDGESLPRLWFPDPTRGLENPVSGMELTLPPADDPPFEFTDFGETQGRQRFFVATALDPLEPGELMAELRRSLEEARRPGEGFEEASTVVADLLKRRGLSLARQDVGVHTR